MPAASQFTTRYKTLNPAQKQAVDTIEGPVMVIAGPGTGKTELLSMRVANILQKTDTAAGSILCLTFTESGAVAMRQRLVGLMGAEAYHVAIHTFHSFGSEIMGTYPKFFYQGADFHPADTLSSYEVLREIFDKLPHDSPLATQLNNEFTQLRDTQTAISELKRSGITPDELLQVLDHNEQFVASTEPLVQRLFATPIRSKKALALLEPLQRHLETYNAPPLSVPNIAALATVCAETFATAFDEAQAQGKTTPITAWRNRWCEKSPTGELVFKDRARSLKLRAVAHVYYEYLVGMQARQLYDFDDMILRVVHALETFDELRLNLQERYQYILVDEFQDTNGAQLRILLNLTNNELYNGRPNILVVGDDDQAIYSFQGAELSNILTFRDQFREPTIITLTDNYRSAPVVLEAARQVITQGEDRLETRIDSLNKNLTPHQNATNSTVRLAELPDKAQEYRWITTEIQQRLNAGQAAETIAVLARNHREMTHLLPYLHHAGIAVQYERRDNILDLPPILALEQLAKALVAMADQQFDALSGMLPALLAHPAWRIPPLKLWELGLMAHRERLHWLEAMLQHEGQLKDIAEWLVVAAHQTTVMPLEEALDLLLGTQEIQAPDDSDAEPNARPPLAFEGYVSPLRDYFFPHTALDVQPGQYIAYLKALQRIRHMLREYRPGTVVTLKDFVEFIELHRATKTPIMSVRSASEASLGVCLMTAHKSKGLEYETVFIVNATHHTWGSGARGRGRMISYPANLPLSPAGETDDERLRLFFVAMTRAKRELIISYALQDSVGKPTLRAGFLASEAIETPTVDTSPQAAITTAEHQWYENVLAVDESDLQKLLTPTLARYKLSSTHLNNFIDVTNGGPRAFLLQNLLRFPQAMAPSAAYGSAIHKTLQKAHAHLSATGTRRPVEDILHDFETHLTDQRLSDLEHERFLQRGSDALQTFLAARYHDFDETAIAERNFAHQGVVIGEALLNGAIDLMLVDPPTKSITVLDYKTGKAAPQWQGSNDFEKIKLHKYRQQLMFYKLLVEQSRDFKDHSVDSGVLEFVEPDKAGRIVQLEMSYDSEELARFTRLIKVVWQRIQALDFPDTSHYEANYKGVLAFEDDLLAGA